MYIYISTGRHMFDSMLEEILSLPKKIFYNLSECNVTNEIF